MSKNNLNKIEKLAKELVNNNLDLVKKQNGLLRQLNLALKLLTRIRKLYPYIFNECIAEKEIEELTKKRR